MIDWHFMYDALRVFGFDQYFFIWVKLLYTDIYIQGRVINNGFASDSFEIKRGVRQGCLLTPYLFIIAVEVLGCFVRQNKDIRGLKVLN